MILPVPLVKRKAIKIFITNQTCPAITAHWVISHNNGIVQPVNKDYSMIEIQKPAMIIVIVLTSGILFPRSVITVCLTPISYHKKE